eukprot:gene12504-8560_t
MKIYTIKNFFFRCNDFSFLIFISEVMHLERSCSRDTNEDWLSHHYTTTRNDTGGTISPCVKLLLTMRFFSRAPPFFVIICLNRIV